MPTRGSWGGVGKPVIARVRPDQVLDVWPVVVDHIDKALRHGIGEMTPADVLDILLRGEWMMLVVLMDGRLVASATLQPVTYPRMRCVRVVTLGGVYMRKWVDTLHDEIKKLARAIGAQGIESVGRAGMSKMLPRLGFQEVARHQFCRLEIDDGQE